jgi:hypothetical protein
MPCFLRHPPAWEHRAQFGRWSFIAAKHHPGIFLKLRSSPDLAVTLNNLGYFYQKNVPGKLPDNPQSLAALAEALKIVLPLSDKLPYKEYADTTWKIVKDWELETEEFAEFSNQLV